MTNCAARGLQLLDELLREVASRVVVPRFPLTPPEEIMRSAGGELSTLVDHEAEEALTRGLAKMRPGTRVIGEEAASARPRLLDELDSDDDVWLVDAIDGTNNFVAGSADYGMMIALIRHRVTVLGAIFQPQHDQMFLTERGGGASVNGEALVRQVQIARELKELRGSVHTRFLDELTQATTTAQANLFGDLTPITSCAAIEYPLIASGSRDFSLFGRIRPWDHAAGALLVTETGGTVARLDGSIYVPSSAGSGLLVTGSESIENQLRDALAFQTAPRLDQ